MPHDKINSKYCLTTSPDGSQNPDVAAKSATGRENPSMLSATTDAPCVFFCVYAYVHLLFTHRFLSRCWICLMVAQAGQPSGWPVPIEAGFSPPSGLPPMSVGTPVVAVTS